MKKIIMILALAMIVGCGSTSINSVEQYSSSENTELSSSYQDESSSSIEYSSSNMPSSSSVKYSSSIPVISSSSSLKISSSSSIKRSSSSVKTSSSSIVSSSSSIVASSSSIVSSSSSQVSSSSIYKSNLFLFDIESSLGLGFYQIPNGEVSPMYEIVSNKIKNLLTNYNWATASMGDSYVGDFHIFKTGTIINGMIQDNVSPNKETITIRRDNVLQLHWNINGSAQVLFKSSDEITMSGKSTYVLHHVVKDEYVCNVYENGGWKSKGFSKDVTNNPFTNGTCTTLSSYKFN